MVGTGWIVRQQIARMGLRGIEVTTLAGTPATMDQVTELADQYHVAGRYDSYETMIAEADIDTVYVGVPNFLHKAVTEAGLAGGKNVICEKPMVSNYREAKEVSDMARSRGLYLWEAVSTDYLPNFAKLKELLPRIGDGTEERYDENGFDDFTGMWDAEFASFKADIESGSTEHCYEMLDEMLRVSRVQTDLRLSTGVRFPADED